jgi:hypothetical protein
MNHKERNVLRKCEARLLLSQIYIFIFILFLNKNLHLRSPLRSSGCELSKPLWLLAGKTANQCQNIRGRVQ